MRWGNIHTNLKYKISYSIIKLFSISKHLLDTNIIIYVRNITVNTFIKKLYFC